MTGQEMRALRLAAGLTQKQLAEKLGYFTKGEPNRTHVAKLELGYQPIGERIALSVKYICEREQQSPAEPKPKRWQEVLAETVTDEETVTISAISDNVPSNGGIL